MEGQDDKGNNLPRPDKRFGLWYMGWSSLDRRTTLPMLPWLVSEIRRKSEKNESGPGQAREVFLTLMPPLIRCVPANSTNASVFIFEHKAQYISRFIHNSHDPLSFAYLIRSQPDNPESEMACHVFRACDPNQVPEVIGSIRQASKVALKEDSKPKQDGGSSGGSSGSCGNSTADESFYNSQKFEVLYRGKVAVASKKTPPTLVDDCIDKFRQHEVERKRLRLLNGQRHSTDNCAPVQFIVGGDDPLGAALSESATEAEEAEEAMVPGNGAGGDTEELPMVDPLGGGPVFGLSSSASVGSLRSAFPECILEDSGFEEQDGGGGRQEVRARCNSLAGSVQRRPRDASLKAAASARRRHASAPSNHVQPSDAEKNRTMLFQVGRFEVNLISPDSKTVVLEKNFKDISSCSQGIKQTDHFGFVCREPVESGGPSQYMCYVFQCASDSLVDEVMLTLRQAFTTAANLRNDKTLVKLCEACPMHALHKLCERIEGLYPPRAKLAIQKYLSQLSDNEQVDIFERVQRMKPGSDHEENELVILHLRQLCGSKQKAHVHIGEGPQNAVSSSSSSTSADSSTTGRSKLDVLKNKAKASLTNSLENIFSRGANRMRGRLGSMGSMSSFDRQDESPGDSPPGTPPSYLDDDGGGDAAPFRRRAHTFSHPPAKKKISFNDTPAPAPKAPPLRRQQSVAPELLQSSPVGPRRKRSVSESESTLTFSLPPSFSTPSFLKSIYQGSLGSLTSLSDLGNPLKSNGEGRKRTLSGCSNDSLTTPTHTPRRVSWRQKIFLRVATPQKNQSSMHTDMDGRELLPLSPRQGLDQDPLSRLLCPEQEPFSGESGRRSPAEYRSLWRKAIHQQILLLRMEKENQRLEASRDELHIRKMKLDYQEVGQDSKEVQAFWERKLSAPCRAKVQWDKEDLQYLSQGVPKTRRGEVWLVLSQQHRLKHRIAVRPPPPDTPYQDLLKQLTAQQHAILVDLGRTFPTHPYFSTQLGAGQLSLYNLLKAYSLLDTEVGYCQGISFVAGVLLLHMSEEQAFDMLKFLMYDLGFRRQFRPDMISLQIQMYQLSRLLHDYHRGLYNHLEEFEICPSLYAAPWFLTLFASQFPLGFVARILDLLFVQGLEVIFKVALCLLSSHEGEIVECDSFETIVDYLKTNLPTLSQVQMEQTIAKASDMDISKQLHAYEVEYHVLQDEMVDALPPSEDAERMDKLEKANAQLKKQNMELLEKLQAARMKIQSLEVNVENFESRESNLKHAIRSLEQEKASYQKTIERMRSSLPRDPSNASLVELTHITHKSNGKAKANTTTSGAAANANANTATSPNNNNNNTLSSSVSAASLAAMVGKKQ
ncbi:TBC1 domain family member 4 [Engraulis encrasicolus]|uniref:TBC1 domain family member 4 n=1 Tax=Engraulis encrasicolus TaxID=184585 RepID=UPI002FD50438